MSNIVSALTSTLPWTFVPFGNERLKHFTNTTTTDALSTLHHNVTPLLNEEMFSYHNPLQLSAYLPAANAADTNSIFFAVLLLIIGITFGLAIIVYINRRLHLSTANVMVAAASTSSAVTLLLQFMNLPGADVSPHIINFFIFSTMIISLYTFFGFFMMFIYLFGLVVTIITKLLRATTANIVVLAASVASLVATALMQYLNLLAANVLSTDTIIFFSLFIWLFIFFGFIFVYLIKVYCSVASDMVAEEEEDDDDLESPENEIYDTVLKDTEHQEQKWYITATLAASFTLILYTLLIQKMITPSSCGYRFGQHLSPELPLVV